MAENLKDELAAKRCSACSGDTPLLSTAQIEKLRSGVSEWEIAGNTRLRRSYKFKNFKFAMDFAVKVGTIAEEERHHPEISIGWGHAEIEIWTHAVNGLTENDFILAAKIDRI